MNQQPTNNFDPLLKVSDIVRGPRSKGYSILPIGRTTFLRGVDAGVYPKPVRIPGSNINYWRLSEIKAVLEAQNEVDHRVGGAA